MVSKAMINDYFRDFDGKAVDIASAWIGYKGMENVGLKLTFNYLEGGLWIDHTASGQNGHRVYFRPHSAADHKAKIFIHPED